MSLEAPANDEIAAPLRRKGRPYEHRLLRFLERISENLPGVVIDVGANIGNHTVYLALGDRKVLALEPNESAAAYLRRNVELNGVGDRVTVVLAAAGASAGRGRVVPTSDDQLGTVRFEVDERGDVAVISVDEVAGDTSVAILKVDVENGEADVLDGASVTIAARSAVIVVESWSRRDRSEVVRRLRAAGYYRFPISLCATPTYAYLPTAALWIRAWFGLEVGEQIVSQLVNPLLSAIRRRRGESLSHP
jgi:FkbM family methyltransferase